MSLTFDPVDPNATLVFEVTIPKGAHSKGATFDLSPTKTHWRGFRGDFLSAQAISMSEHPFGVEARQAVVLVSGFSTVVDAHGAETPFQTIPLAPERARLQGFTVTAEAFLLTLRLDADIAVYTTVRLRLFFQGLARLKTQGMNA